MNLIVFLTMLSPLLPSNALTRHLKGSKTKIRDEEFVDLAQAVMTRKSQANEVPTNSRSSSPEELCSAFMIYDFMTRKMQRERGANREDRNDIYWSSACAPLESLNQQLCPTGQYLEDICTGPYRINLSPSVNYDYCKPLLANIENDKDRSDCTSACVKYVSRDRGDCCTFSCE